MATIHERIVGNKSISIKVFEDGGACIYDQAINAKTGKGWQAHRNNENFDNATKAMWAWAKRK